MSKYSIYDKHFKTKLECHKYTSNLINSLKTCYIFKDNTYYNFFVELLNNHPHKKEKIGDGVKGFKIEKHPIYEYYQIFLIRNDDEIINFSYVQCCKFETNSKISDSEYNLKRAMRTAVDDQINEFRNKNIKKCCICEARCEFIEYHIDHKNPSYNYLYKNFIKKFPNYPTTFKKSKLFRIEFNKEDEEYKNNWWLYHLNNASLQILCKKCNLTKPREKI